MEKDEDKERKRERKGGKKLFFSITDYLGRVYTHSRGEMNMEIDV